MDYRLTNEQAAFIRYLTGLTTEKDGGVLAVMRRGLMGNPVEDLNLYRFVASHVPDPDRQTPREPIYYLIASLYALNSRSGGDGNMGKHLRQAAGKRDDMEAAERRFTALLNTQMDDLNKPLRQAVTLLAQQELPVNWTALFDDLLHWAHPRKYVQRAWANGFWGFQTPAENQN